MKDRIHRFLQTEKVSSAEFADRIGVQRSSMSHILNGRNQPSATFIQKMLLAFPNLNPRWLLIGEGKMYHDPVSDLSGQKPHVANHPSDVRMNDLNDAEAGKEPKSLKKHMEAQAELFGTPFDFTTIDNSDPVQTTKVTHEEKEGSLPVNDFLLGPKAVKSTSIQPSEDKTIDQIVILFSDKTFMVYRPS